jgi:hypothetical protein
MRTAHRREQREGEEGREGRCGRTWRGRLLRSGSRLILMVLYVSHILAEVLAVIEALAVVVECLVADGEWPFPDMSNEERHSSNHPKAKSSIEANR